MDITEMSHELKIAIDYITKQGLDNVVKDCHASNTFQYICRSASDSVEITAFHVS